MDRIVGPWFLEPWRTLAREDYEMHYIVLRASKDETLRQAVERSKLDRKTNLELVETMWKQFCNLGIYESNVIETITYSIQETVFAVKEKNRKWKRIVILSNSCHDIYLFFFYF